MICVNTVVLDKVSIEIKRWLRGRTLYRNFDHVRQVCCFDAVLICDKSLHIPSEELESVAARWPELRITLIYRYGSDNDDGELYHKGGMIMWWKGVRMM